MATKSGHLLGLIFVMAFAVSLGMACKTSTQNPDSQAQDKAPKEAAPAPVPSSQDLADASQKEGLDFLGRPPFLKPGQRAPAFSLNRGAGYFVRLSSGAFRFEALDQQSQLISSTPLNISEAQLNEAAKSFELEDDQNKLLSMPLLFPSDGTLLCLTDSLCSQSNEEEVFLLLFDPKRSQFSNPTQDALAEEVVNRHFEGVALQAQFKDFLKPTSIHITTEENTLSLSFPDSRSGSSLQKLTWSFDPEKQHQTLSAAGQSAELFFLQQEDYLITIITMKERWIWAITRLDLKRPGEISPV